MFNLLLKTEFNSNRIIWLAWVLANLLVFVMIDGSGEDPADDFMAMTMVAYFVLLIVSASFGSEEKRIRMYSQLPVTPSQVFLASWFWVLLMLGLQVCLWLLFAYWHDPEFDTNEIMKISTSALGIYFMIALIAIGIDLGFYRPAYLQWVYIGAAALIITVAIRYDISVGLIGTEDGIRIYPLHAILQTTDARSGIALSIALIAVLKISDWYIYTHSDNYLR